MKSTQLLVGAVILFVLSVVWWVSGTPARACDVFSAEKVIRADYRALRAKETKP